MPNGLRSKKIVTGIADVPDLVSGSDVQLYCAHDRVLVIGCGQYGIVCLGRHKKSGHLLAIKLLYRDKCLESHVLHEACILQLVTSTGATPRFYGLAFLNQIPEESDLWNYCLVMDYVGDPHTLGVTSLHTYVRVLRSMKYFSTSQNKSHQVKLRQILLLVQRMVDGLLRIHQLGVILNDVKLDNILLACDQNGQWQPCFLDFGMAKVRNYRMEYKFNKSTEGERAFLERFFQVAPEVLQTGQCTPASDVYSFGWILLYLGHWLDIYWLISLGNWCLSPQEMRPTTEVLRHNVQSAIDKADKFQFFPWLVMLRERMNFRSKCLIRRM